MPAQRDPYDAPAVRAFSIALERWRDAGGLSKTQLAESLGYTSQFIGQIEAAKNIPSKAFAQDLDTYFKTDDFFLKFWKLVNETRHLAVLPPGFSKYVELENRATTIRIFEALLITGLFQTDGYARAMMGSLMSPEAIDDAINARMERKAIFERQNPPHAFFIIDEWALRRVIGSPDVVREQLAYLLELTKRPEIIVQVLPHDTEHYVALSGSFTLLGFDDESDVAYIEAAGQGNLIDRPPAVTNCAIRYDLLRGHACSVEESRRIIRKVMETL
jgi:transcriptional regulator with XRE-family HTH domain